MRRTKYYVCRMHHNGECEFCNDFETKEKAQAYIKRKTDHNPFAEYQIFERFQ